MDYEQKYNAALERAAKLRVQNPFDTVGQMVEHIFPELKESEGEQIRKWCISHFKSCINVIKDNDEYKEYLNNKVIHWLEKQDKQEPIPITDEWIEDYWQHEKVINPYSYDKGEEIQFDHQGFVNFCKKYCKKPVERNKEDKKIRKELIAHFRNTRCVTEEGAEKIAQWVAWLDNQGVQPTDKVEPKFKVGNYIVLPLGIIARINSLNSTDYQVTTTGGKICDFKISKQDNYHLWTIEDAKDGDVLSIKIKDEVFIVLFNQIHDMWIITHCCYSETTSKFIEGAHFCYHYRDLFMPTIKEQRDTLFENMKEAGYKWDSAKKELKTIEQNPADNIEPKFHPGDWVILNGTVAQILDKQKYGFVGLDTDGKDFFCNYGHTDSMRLWTLADAKDGDVLAYKNDDVEWVLIYKSIIPETYDVSQDILKYHALLTDTDFYDNSIAVMISENYASYFTPATKEQHDLFFTKMKEAGYEWDSEKKELRKIEQKHVNKVEPKFKNEDWIIHQGTENIYQVVACVDNQYQLKYGDNYTVQKCADVDRCARLWTIADAKRGDVLVDVYGNIGIFDKCYDFDWVSCCSLGNNRGFQYFTVEHENEETYPATKEQRDLFFSKMKEAGWEWDSKNKELKKNL